MSPYLILHKVRGEPAFDIAEKIQIGDEQGWIIPTSGHRAYASWWMPLEKITVNPDDRASIVYLANAVGVPDDWPDHYETKPEPKIKLDVRALLSAVRPVLNFKRRI